MRELVCETHGVANGNICGPNCKISRKQASFSSLRSMPFFTRKRMIIVLLLATIITAGGIGYVLGSSSQGPTFTKPGQVTGVFQANNIVFISASASFATNTFNVTIQNTGGATQAGTLILKLTPGPSPSSQIYSLAVSQKEQFNFTTVSLTGMTSYEIDW